jgi:hypothetical protein
VFSWKIKLLVVKSQGACHQDELISGEPPVVKYYYYYYLVYEAIGTEATPGLLCQPRVIVKMIVEKQMERRLAGETEDLGENLTQRHFCPSQNPT